MNVFLGTTTERLVISMIEVNLRENYIDNELTDSYVVLHQSNDYFMSETFIIHLSELDEVISKLQEIRDYE